MDDDEFWALLKKLNWDATGDDDAVVAPVVAELAQADVADIVEFDNILARKLFALDTEQHAKNIGEDAYREGEHFSVDWFLYTRCCVVANGKDLFEAVVTSPTDFPKDMEFEALLNIAAAAYEEKTGEEYSHVTTPSYETFSNAKGWGKD